MTVGRKEIIETLKRELEILETGGYEPSPYEPHRMPRVFRDSVSCPNVGLEFTIEPCAHCFLMQFVPPEHRDKDDACQYIPLNTRGDTIASLDRKGNEKAVQAALRAWLQKTMFRLAEETDSSGPEEERVFPQLLSSGDGRSRPLMRRGN